MHLPKGSYSIGTTLSVPANADLQIVGDGTNSQLNWSGVAGGTILRMNGPSRAILRDFIRANGGNAANGIAIENADQPGARVYLEGFVTEPPMQTTLLADGLTSTVVELHGGYPMNDSQSLYVCRGVGGAGNSVVAIFGASTGSNAHTFPLWDVQNGGRMLVEDTWFEGPNSRAVRLSGTETFTFWAGLLAPDNDTNNPRESSHRAERVFWKGDVRRGDVELVRQCLPRDGGHQRDQSNERTLSWECRLLRTLFLADRVGRKRLIFE